MTVDGFGLEPGDHVRDLEGVVLKVSDDGDSLIVTIAINPYEKVIVL